MGHKNNIDHWAEELPKLAQATKEFFQKADNEESPCAFDLDPRPGHVRLGETRVVGPFSAFASVVRGLMNDKGDLQAILSQDQETTILTITDGGHTICRQRGEECETFRVTPLFTKSA